MARSHGSIRTTAVEFHELLEADTRPVPDSYWRSSPIETGPTQIPVERYTSRAFHDLEVEKVWRRAWQMACHEDDLPDVGDFVPYDIAGMSFLVVRTGSDEFRAYYNACLHRGRKLRERRGKRAGELRCMFHGWCWNLDGSLKQIPCAWDFPDVDRAEQSLPQVQVGRWGRFLFINPDPGCEPFEDYIGDLSSHFQVLPYERRYKEAHVAKIMRCNWKVCQEAFMEAYHVAATHPTIITGDIHEPNSVYDVFGNYSRAITTGGLENSRPPEWDPLPSDGRLRVRHPLDGLVYEARDDGQVRVTAPDGRTGVFTPEGYWVEGELGDVNPHLCSWVGGRQLARPDPSAAWARRDGPRRADASRTPLSPRAMMASMQREALRPAIGELADRVADVEFASVYFTLFPNFHPWGSFNRIVYRFRPHGNDPDESIMECMYLAPIPEDGRYEPARDIHWLGPDDDWTDAPELGMLAKVFNQDTRNLPYVQQGLHATHRDFVQFASYAETKPRHFHALLEEWIARP